MKTNTGIFQGSPLSALLFVIYITSMMANFRTNKLTPDNNQRAQHNRQPNHLHGEPANLYIRKKDENSEHNTTIETFKKKFAEIYLKQKYKTKTIQAISIKVDLEDLQYADDTTLTNEKPETIVPNLRCYSDSATPFDILINWLKTIIISNKWNLKI